ncbi:TRAP transporter small permease [Actinomyces sp. B33]|uniref:TRAP transporter small permease n=1 Tax=Actinomyces sp. B33 TaxID=2942131 RepID=UPI0023427B4D|nr:TRAP transporter small permease [Actinomyces sp. B33]MDC4233342.1 TRAP transporter small permease [Actinomyces sp. B33]
MLLTVTDVISRLITGGSVPGLLEFTEVALVFLVFCGIAYGQQQKTHVAVTLVTSRLPERIGRTVVVLGLLIILALFAWATFATGSQALDSVMRQEARFGLAAVPIWPARVVLPIGFFLLFGETLIQLLNVIGGREKIREESLPVESEILS